MLSSFSLLRGLQRKSYASAAYSKPLAATRVAVSGRFNALMDPNKALILTDKDPAPAVGDPTFAYCFGCQTCTTVCPVVGNYENAQEVLGLLPHQIMFALALRQTEMASGARMIWDCVTCYQCQENCPQNVRVTELLFGLKNSAVRTAQSDAL